MKKQERLSQSKLFLNKESVAILTKSDMEKIVTGMEDTIARITLGCAPQSTQDDFNCDYFNQESGDRPLQQQ
ncbi:hypothetical protein SAMN05444266_102297 [Chitinophaga jiangningensis]|uniref:Uncharacterized protein n=1 Tax=Chitinophaga jiangningensis TaxID=1419482 RepID=A0A1M6YFJ8_9BACT|nr:class I lanthipeptide [Chitinophaga jiangningensis]SHL17091.1 hypothetical protein SAMN05444266_102297 [Chitinophaga jiangningensis]